MVFLTLALATSTTERSHEHQLVTRTVLSSGVTATYLGTAPTGITWSILSVAVSMRYRKLLSGCEAGVQESLPSGPKFAPYIE